MGRRLARRLARSAQPLTPDVVYSQPVVPNIGVKPGPGSVRVPLKVPLDDIVPRNSIADVLPALLLKKMSVKPSVRRTDPVSGRINVVGGFCQLLVPALRVPSEATSS